MATTLEDLTVGNSVFVTNGGRPWGLGIVAYSPARIDASLVEVFIGSRVRYESIIEDGEMDTARLWVCNPDELQVRAWSGV